MSQLTPTEAAKFAKKAKSTIYKDMKASVLSFTVERNRKLIETSELIRVYGSPATRSNAALLPEATAADTELRIELAAVKAELASMKDHVETLKNTNETLSNALRSLTFSQPKTPEKQPENATFAPDREERSKDVGLTGRLKTLIFGGK